MKKTLFMLTAFIACIQVAFAQQPKVEMSDPFDEPEGLESKVVQCSNGNTFLFNFTKKEGIEISLYGKDRKVIAHSNVTGKEWEARDMMRSQIDGIYEIDGKLAMFMEQTSDRVPALYLIVLDPVTASVVLEKKIAEMPKYKAGAGYAMLFGHVDPKTFHVEKDPESDAYAVAVFDGFAEETAHRIEVIHFNGKHEEVNRAYYDSPENRYKYIRYIGMAVEGTNNVYLCSYAFNTEASGGKTSKVFLSRLRKGSKEMEHKPVEITRDFKNTTGVMVYNPGNKTLNLLSVSFIGKEGNKSTFGALLTSFDPESMTILYSKPFVAEKAGDYKRGNLDQKSRYTGMPMNLFVNPDHTFTVVMEEQMIEYKTSNFGMVSTVSMANLRDIGIVDMDEHALEQQGYVIQKNQASRIDIPALSLYERQKNFVAFERKIGFGTYANSGFFSFDYVATPKSRYIFFNDHPDNFSRPEKKAPQNVVAITETNTVCYKLDNGKMTKCYLYGTPLKKGDTRFAFISSSNFQPATNTYAAMIIDYFGKKKVARLAWAILD